MSRIGTIFRSLIKHVQTNLGHVLPTDGTLVLAAEDPHPGGALRADVVVAQPDGEDPAAVEAHGAVVLAALGHLRDESLPLLRGRAEGRSATLIAVIGISITKFSTTSVSEL